MSPNGRFSSVVAREAPELDVRLALVLARVEQSYERMACEARQGQHVATEEGAREDSFYCATLIWFAVHKFRNGRNDSLHLLYSTQARLAFLLVHQFFPFGIISASASVNAMSLLPIE